MMPNAYLNDARLQFILRYLNTNKWSVLIAFVGRFSIVSATHMLLVTMPIIDRNARPLRLRCGRTIVLPTHGGVAVDTNHTQRRWVTAGGRSRAHIVLLACADRQDKQKMTGAVMSDEHLAWVVLTRVAAWV